VRRKEKERLKGRNKRKKEDAKEKRNKERT
jgi:hypothetical protein